MLVPYTHLNHVLIGHLTDDNINALDYQPEINFQNYVASQLYYGACVDIYERNVLEYNTVYDYLVKNKYNGYNTDNAINKVLKYYYSDLADMVLRSKSEPKKDFSLLRHTGFAHSDKFSNIQSCLIDIKYMEDLVVKFIKSDDVYSDDIFDDNKYDIDLETFFDPVVNDLFNYKCTRLVTEALILKYYSVQKKTVKIILEEVN